ncbi:MAG: hypothetical protein PHD02_01945 [Bacilli bacterium]|nr:hypothetical protein [Bacilli bacterium]
MIVSDALAIILYVLLSILVVVLIVFVIRLFKTIKKVEKVVDDVNSKSEKLNGVFNIIDSTTDTLSVITDKFTNLAVKALSALFMKKKGKEENDDE